MFYYIKFFPQAFVQPLICTGFLEIRLTSAHLGPTAKTLAQIGLLTSSRGPVCIETLEGIASLPLKDYIARFEYGDTLMVIVLAKGHITEDRNFLPASQINDLR
jgi:hypothetical protein